MMIILFIIYFIFFKNELYIHDEIELFVFG